MPGREWTDDRGRIPDDAVLWRRVPALHVLPGVTPAEWALSSAAFEDDEGEEDEDLRHMSVVIAKDSTLERVLDKHEGYGVWSVRAGCIREIPFIIAPYPEPDEPAHAFVIGDKTRGRRKMLVRCGWWEVRPPGWPDEHLRNTRRCNHGAT